MSRPTISIAKLDDAIAAELHLYAEEVREEMDKAGEQSMRELVRLTKATAPANSGKFRKSITSTAKPGITGTRYIWHVKPPHHRLTHLLVHGHATVNGGRTRADPFLENALDQVLPEYEKAVEEAVRK